MSEGHQGASRRVARIAAWPVAAGLIAYHALDALLGPLVRPALRALRATRLAERAAAAIRALPPYGVLALLAVPFAVLEPVKALALYWLATGRPLAGAGLLAAAHLASIVTTERILHVGRERLLAIGWFARLWSAAVGLRDRALRLIRGTPAWRVGTALAGRARTLVLRLFPGAGERRL